MRNINRRERRKMAQSIMLYGASDTLVMRHTRLNQRTVASLRLGLPKRFPTIWGLVD